LLEERPLGRVSKDGYIGPHGSRRRKRLLTMRDWPAF
jgi:hypothetical protein